MKQEPVRTIHAAAEDGFTLIELLVVVASMTLLIALLLPALHKARQVADRVACQAKLRQITVAWHAYLSDHDGKFYQGENANALYGGWRGTDFPDHPRVLNGYLGLDPLPVSKDQATKVFWCPGDKGHDGPAYYHALGTSYQTNILLVGQNQVAPLPNETLRHEINSRLRNITLQQVDVPQRVLLIGDYGWGVQWIPLYPAGPDWHGRQHHYNVAFLDGHVGFLHIRKGLYITDAYTVLPSKDLYGLARTVQQEELGE